MDSRGCDLVPSLVCFWQTTLHDGLFLRSMFQVDAPKYFLHLLPCHIFTHSFSYFCRVV